MGTENIIAFQGVAGAYSQLACKSVFPDMDSLPCQDFETALEAVTNKQAELAMIPIENSLGGRVAEIHNLLSTTNLSIIGEHFQPIIHKLLAVKGSKLADIKNVFSHLQALAQCRQRIRQQAFTANISTDTALAAKEVAAKQDTSIAALASSLAGEIYNLESLDDNFADSTDNVTRFIIMARQPLKQLSEPAITSLLFQLRSIPAALYKALGGFATNGVNITKLESYIKDSQFRVAQFYVDIDGRQGTPEVENALDELRHFTTSLNILGSYPASSYRGLKS